MRIENISIKALIIGALLFIGAIGISTSFIAENQYRKVAAEAHLVNVSHILGAASNAALSEMEIDASHLASYLAEAPAGTANPVLAKLLHAPLDTDLPRLRPVSTHLYNSSRQLLMSSGEETGQDSPLLQRENLDESAQGFWLDGDLPRYSIVSPVGKNAGKGYLEIRFDPVHALQSVANLTGRAVRIESTGGTPLYESPEWTKPGEGISEVTLLVKPGDGPPLAKLAVLDDLSALYAATVKERNSMIGMFAAALAIALLVVIVLLDRFLLRPLGSMLEEWWKVSSSVNVRPRMIFVAKLN